MHVTAGLGLPVAEIATLISSQATAEAQYWISPGPRTKSGFPNLQRPGAAVRILPIPAGIPILKTWANCSRSDP